MKEEKVIQLLDKYHNGSSTPEENAVVESWYNSKIIENSNAVISDDLELANSLIRSEIEKVLPVIKPRIFKFPMIAAAAAIFLIVAVGIFFYNHNANTARNIDDSRDLADITPGTNKATLTLASGKKIRLSDATNGELAEEAGVTITKSKDGKLVYQIKKTENNEAKINTLSTANGETYQVKLPDGSLAYLNSGSSLVYTTSLIKQGKREVTLKGEGYFEIAKDKDHPFVVKTTTNLGTQEVEVLGTHFNVNAYEDETVVATTLLEGSVKITSGAIKRLLRPGEQALNAGKSIAVNPVDTENITDWKDGDFYFENVDFRSAMRKIARWYNVEVIYDPSVPSNITSNGWISRNNKLSAVLNSIEKSGQVHFKIQGRKIYVTK